MKPYQRTSADFPEEIRPELKEKCDAMKAGLHKERTKHVLYRHDFGRELDEILNDPDTYGDCHRSMRHVANELELTESSLKDHVDVFRTFKRAEVDQLVQRSVNEDVRLSFSHLVALTKVVGNQRAKFISRIFDEGLSANDLQNEVLALIGSRRKSGAGRKPKRATPPMAGYTDLIKTTCSYRKKVAEVWDPLFIEVNEISPDKIDKSLLGKMNEADETLRDFIDMLHAVRGSIESNRKRANDVIALRTGEAFDAMAAITGGDKVTGLAVEDPIELYQVEDDSFKDNEADSIGVEEEGPRTKLKNNAASPSSAS